MKMADDAAKSKIYDIRTIQYIISTGSLSSVPQEVTLNLLAVQEAP